MRLTEVQKMLNENNIPFTQMMESWKENSSKRNGEEKEVIESVCLLTIWNPNHEKNIDMWLDGNSEDPEFSDLGFGGYCYEMFLRKEEDLQQTVLSEIKYILSGKRWVVYKSNAKTGAWPSGKIFCDGDETDEDDRNDMKKLHKTVSRIRKWKNLLHKLTGQATCYEIYNWNTYEKIIK